MAKSRWMVNLVARTLVFLWIGTFAAGQYPRDPMQSPGIPDSKHSPHVVRGSAYLRQKIAVQAGNPKFPEPIMRVEPIYPEKAWKAGIGGYLGADISINELGEVTNVSLTEHCPPGFSCPPEIKEATMAAVRLWRYLPKFQNGKAIPQFAFTLILFDPRAKWHVGGVGVKINRKGDLYEFSGAPISIDKLKASEQIIVTCESSVPFPILEKALRNLQDQEIKNFRLSAWSYAFVAGRLFYRVLSGNAEIPEVDGPIQPPKLDIDIDHLAAVAKASGPSSYLPSSAIGGGLMVSVTYLSYVIYVSERGEIIAVERTGGPEVPEVETSLRQTRVLLPGQRGGDPVPVVVSVLIPIQ